MLFGQRQYAYDFANLRLMLTKCFKIETAIMVMIQLQDHWGQSAFTILQIQKQCYVVLIKIQFCTKIKLNVHMNYRLLFCKQDGT